jgi:hypothetical protein
LGTPLAKEIVASKLPRAEKLGLLEDGAANKRLAHRHAALEALADLDLPTFRKHLIATLKWFPPDIEGWSYWMCPEAKIARLVRRTEDPTCWDALAATARRASVALRMELVAEMRWSDGPDRDKLTRRERLRFLVGFLADESTRGDTPPPGKVFDSFYAAPRSPSGQVRDVAVVELARWLGFEMEFDDKRGPFSRAFIRAAVVKAAAEELERLKK